ncbi:MAG: hypothetical protein WC784_03140 [Candidatus Shapirobacteria bacterium]|jgi:hypothetical protein
MENLKLFNQEMVDLGLMRETTKKDRQQIRFSGRELSPTEEKCYLTIYSSGVTPISAENLAKKILKDQLTYSKAGKRNIYQIVARIKQKLGSEEIISRNDFGYISRRAMINNMVTKNK